MTEVSGLGSLCTWRVAAKRQNVGNATRGIRLQDLVDFSSAVTNTSEVRHWRKRGVGGQPGHQGIGAITSAAAGSIGHRNKRWLERFEFWKRGHEFIPRRIGAWREELETGGHSVPGKDVANMHAGSLGCADPGVTLRLMPVHARVPRPTAQRLSLYLRELERIDAMEQLTVSSRQLGESVGAADAQVRKDLGIIGHSGIPGIGYRVGALAAYRSFHQQGFEIVAVFDASAAVVGRTVAQLRVRPMSDLAATVAREDIGIGIIAVPPECAQEVADELVEAGVRGILNFAPRLLSVGDRVSLVNVDFRSALEHLVHDVSQRDMAAIAEAESKPVIRRGRRRGAA